MNYTMLNYTGGIVRYFHTHLAGPALTWWLSVLDEFGRARRVVSEQDLVNAWHLKYEPTIFSRREEAHAALLQGKCTMKSSVIDYAQEFLSLVRDAESMDLATQIALFLQGLSPDLHALCVVHPLTAQPWTDIHALITFTLGQEKRARIAKLPSTKPPQVPEANAADGGYRGRNRTINHGRTHGGGRGYGRSKLEDALPSGTGLTEFG